MWNLRGIIKNGSNAKKHLIWILFLVSIKLPAQDSTVSKFRHSIYIEFGGASWSMFSLNYEIRSKLLALRVGGGLISHRNNTNPSGARTKVISIPLELFFFDGSSQPGNFELGIFYTPTYGDRSYVESLNPKTNSYIRHSYFFDPTTGFQLGWRSTPRDNHFLIKIDFTVLFLSKNQNVDNNYQSSFIRYWGGLTMGYTFNKYE